MEQIPTDGSYFEGYNACNRSMGKPGCKSLVRRLNLDRAPEGAHVFLCNLHWDKEMQHRTWQNERGVAEPWDVFDFYEPDPMYFEQKEMTQAKTPKPFYPVINFAVHGKDSAALFDVHYAYDTGEKLSSGVYETKISRDILRKSVEEAREHMSNLKRPHGLVAIFDSVESSTDRVTRYDFIEYVLEAIIINGKGVLKYG